MDKVKNPRSRGYNARKGCVLMSVWIYVDTRLQVGDKNYLQVFASPEAAELWLAEVWRSNTT